MASTSESERYTLASSTHTIGFADPLLVTIGGPGLNNWDMALLKNTNFTETKVLQLRFEAFNIFNHAQFINPSGSINEGLPLIVDGVNQGGNFGVVTSARSPRIMQIAAKFTF